VAVPTPGAIGGFHAAYRIAVQMFFGAPPDRALGGAFVLHAISFLPVTILGAIFMFSEGLTLTGVRELAESAPASPADQSTEAGARAAGSGPMKAGAPAAGNQRYDARAERDGQAAMVPPGKGSARGSVRIVAPLGRRWWTPARAKKGKSFDGGESASAVRAGSPATSGSTRSRIWGSRKTAAASGSSGRNCLPDCSKRAKNARRVWRRSRRSRIVSNPRCRTSPSV